MLRSGFAGLPSGTYVGGYVPTGANLTETGNPQIPAGTVFPTGAFTQTTVDATGSNITTNATGDNIPGRNIGIDTRFKSNKKT
uniref:Uncharacterized protein n=1 Tax=Tolypothrix bouteillei VB521301 TaxID=1479485 RepID=A0A0C1R2G3_9CYAN